MYEVYELTVVNKETELTVEEKVDSWEVVHNTIQINYVNGVVHVFELGNKDNEKTFSFTPVKKEKPNG